MKKLILLFCLSLPLYTSAKDADFSAPTATLTIPQVKVDGTYVTEVKLKQIGPDTFKLENYTPVKPRGLLAGTFEDSDYAFGPNCPDPITPEKVAQIKLGMDPGMINKIFGCFFRHFKDFTDSAAPNVAFEWVSRGSGERFVGYFTINPPSGKYSELLAWDYKPD